jgi:anti-sigma-K factor RskA
MTERVLPFEGSEHAASDVLLPFYANGSLRGEERAFVEQHLSSCEECRREVDWLRAVYAACAASPLLQDAARTLPESRAEVVDDSSRQPVTLGIRERWFAAQPWTRWLMAAQLAAIVVLATLLATDTGDVASYRTLGAPNSTPQSRDSVAVMFDPAIKEADLRRIVQGIDARIIDGPTSTAVFVLEIPAARTDQALAALRAEPAVRLAERLGAGTNR